MYYVNLAWQYMKKKKSRTICSIIGIVFTFILCFSTITAGYSVMDYALKSIYTKNKHTQLYIAEGNWTKEQLDNLMAYANVEKIYFYDELECRFLSQKQIKERSSYGIRIALKDTSHLRQTAEDISTRLELPVQVDEDVEMWLNQGDTATIYLFRTCILIVASVFAVFSIFVLRNTMTISVVERMKDYGLFRCVGMSKKQLYHLLLTEGLLMGSCGVIGGIGAGYGFLHILEPFINDALLLQTSFHFGFYPSAIFFTILLCIGVTSFSLLEPGRQAGLLSPIEAVKNQITLQRKRGNKHYDGKLFGFLFGVEGEYAYKNMKRNRGKAGYVAIGIFLCITLVGTLFSFSDSTYATLQNLYKGQAMEFSESIFVNQPYSEELVKTITKDLKNIGGIENTGIYLAREHYMFYDNKLQQQGVDFCAEIGYNREHMEQLKKYVIEGTISFSKMQTENSVILCDTLHNIMDETGNQVDKRITTYQVGDTISFLSVQGQQKAETLFSSTLMEAATKLGILTTTENRSVKSTTLETLQYYSSEQEDFSKLLKTCISLLKEKGYDCTSYEDTSQYTRILQLKNVLLKMMYQKGMRDDCVIQAIISEDIFNSGRYEQTSDAPILLVRPDSFIQARLSNQTFDYKNIYTDYYWSIGFNRDIKKTSSDFYHYCEKKSNNGAKYFYSENVDTTKDLLTTLKTTRLIVLFTSCFIGLISLVQIFNTVCASMALRNQELLTYEAIGMTRKQERKMILLENGVVVFISIGIGILFSYGFSRYIVDDLLNVNGSVCFVFPFIKVTGMSVLMFLATCVVSILGMRKKR